MNTRAPSILTKLWPSTKSVSRQETLARFAKFTTPHSDTKEIHNAALDVPVGLLKVTPPDPLSCAITTLSSVPSAKTSLALVKPFQKPHEHSPYLPNVRRLHVKHQGQSYRKPAPSQDRHLAELPEIYLKFLVYNKRNADAIQFMEKLLKDHDPNSQRLPTGISTFFAFEFIAYGIQLGATKQILQIYDLASRQVDAPSGPGHMSPTTPAPNQFRIYGHHGLTLALVRYLVKLSKKGPNRLTGWNKARVEENPKFFSATAERMYAAYANVHGFDKFDSENYEPGSDEALTNPWVGVAISCLFELGRYEPALKALSSLFDRWIRDAGDAQSSKVTKLPATVSWKNPNPMDSLFPSLVQPSPPSLKSLEMILPSLAQRDLDSAIKFLLKVAPARLAGFQTNSRLYQVVIYELLKQQKLDEAFNIVEHGKKERIRFGYKGLDAFIQASLKDITDSWSRSSPSSGSQLMSDELEAMSTKRLDAFARILEVLRILRKRAKVSTVQEAVEVALAVELPKVAWEIGTWGRDLGILGDESAMGESGILPPAA